MRPTPQDSDRVAGEELDPRGCIGTPWVDDQGRARQPHITCYADDGTVTYGAEALGQFRRLCQANRIARSRARSASPPAPARPRAGRAPRPASNARTRGSRRAAAGSRAGPDDPDSDEPPGGRLCRCGCGASIDHRHPLARYLNDTHSARHRKSEERARKRARGDAPGKPPTLPTASRRAELLAELELDCWRELMEGEAQVLTRANGRALRPGPWAA